MPFAVCLDPIRVTAVRMTGVIFIDTTATTTAMRRDWHTIFKAHRVTTSFLAVR
jgi:hypothetical protein